MSDNRPGKPRDSLNRVGLFSTPWPLFNRPSIQLGTLKAYIKRQFPEIDCRACHLYLNIAAELGYHEYQAISERSWLSESVYAAILFPEQFDKIEDLFQKKSRKDKRLSGLDFENLTQKVKALSDAFIRQTDWSVFGLAGFSVCLCQLTSSLYFIKKIKSTAPKLPLVAGGSIIGGESAVCLLNSFPSIDFIINGEGELPLAKLIEHLRKRGTLDEFPDTPGVVTRKTPPIQNSGSFFQFCDLKAIPIPDYQEYFGILASLPPAKTFFPTLPAEISRGCWWRKPDFFGTDKGCAFCNLNVQWSGYRVKTADQVVSEIDYLTSRHQVLSVAFMDNALPPQRSRRVFHRLSGLKKDFKFFSEIRAATDREILEDFANAGMAEIQVGIEALSTNLLKKLNKGTTAIENLEIMKNCEALGIKNISNLILRFPGSSEKDVKETLRALDFARVFRPLKLVRFWLGMESSVWKNPEKFGIKAVFNHPNYRHLFPEKIYRSARFMIQDYRGGKTFQKSLWRPVEKAVSNWQKSYDSLHGAPDSGPILSFQDGREFMIIHERKAGEPPANHRLTGVSRKIYLFCEHRRTTEEILNEHPTISEQKLLPFLRMMTEKRLMFEDGGQYLSLAVPGRN